MPSMRRFPTRSMAWRLVWPLALALGLALGVAGNAEAGRKKKPVKPRYLFEVSQVKLAEGIPAPINELVRALLTVAIDKNPVLLRELDAGAPDPKTAPKKFKRYLKRKKLRAFKVNVEVLSYRHEVEQLPEPRKGQRLTVAIVLRTFGETVPDRVMAFAGEGSATVKLDIGRKLRKRDSEVGNNDSTELAIAEALDRSIKKLGEKPRGKPKRAKK